MKTIFRNFIHILKRFKVASILNILGLSAAIAVFIVCMIQVKYDFTFNHYFTNVSKLYLITQNQNTTYGEHRTYNMFNKNLETLRQNIPQLDKSHTTQMHTYGGSRRINKENSKDTFWEPVTSVESNFFDIFNIEIIEGNAKEALSDINQLIISESVSKKCFGDESPIGKTLIVSMSKTERLEDGVSISDAELPMVIKAVYKDFPNNTSFDNGLITSLQNPERLEIITDSGTAWTGSMYTYYKVDNEDEKQQIETILSDKKIIDLLKIDNPNKKNIKKAKGEGELQVLKTSLELTPISNIQIHHPDATSKGKSISRVLALLAIGCVTLIIAYINFMNFITAMAPARLKTINIQKILGANRITQSLSIISEAIFLTLIALAISLFVVHWISTSAELSHFFEASINLADNLHFILLLSIILACIAAIAAIYPAIYLTKFKPIVNYGGASANTKGSGLRSALTIIQYLAAIVLILVALFIKIQHNYMKYHDMGLDKENVIYVDNIDNRGGTIINDAQTYASEALKSPVILESTAADYKIGSGIISIFGEERNGEFILSSRFSARKNFLDFFGIKVIANDSELKVKDKHTFETYNQTFINSISDKRRKEMEAENIIIFEDFNFDKIQNPIEGLNITLNDTKENNSYIYFKLPADGIGEGIKHLENTWKKMTTSPFNIYFLDEEIAKQYKAEQDLAFLLSVFSFTVILIAVMGVYGLITFSSRYKAKEIAIRKVQGATEKQIILLLNKGILSQFILAFILAVPIAYYIVDKWLEQFAFKTPVYWWVFLLGAAIIFVITVITVSVQSYRAATANPIFALKDE
ncbi:ABC transporter permease [Dysgonomonas sp. Marseille-P4677]|uniref:ABC transporter permease n=1 Tax=Dysgonomonas sp. Marseille-P4677 TaxID=2364790 RepID=UPI001911330B|nr:ABC transporter permease [Dysgonomonas sp. Marseille-P4677]MBK5721338.1 ABC transporter permease [Dysgonomonas sp. Marseille-P4677]